MKKTARLVTWRLVLPGNPQQWMADTSLGRVKAEKLKTDSTFHVTLPDGRSQFFPNLKEAKTWVETEVSELVTSN